MFAVGDGISGPVVVDGVELGEVLIPVVGELEDVVVEVTELRDVVATSIPGPAPQDTVSAPPIVRFDRPSCGLRGYR